MSPEDFTPDERYHIRCWQGNFRIGNSMLMDIGGGRCPEKNDPVLQHFIALGLISKTTPELHVVERGGKFLREPHPNGKTKTAPDGFFYYTEKAQEVYDMLMRS